jgi:hypothetical protein
MPQPIQECIKAVFDFEFQAVRSLSEKVIPFLDHEQAGHAPVHLSTVSPGLAAVRGDLTRIDELAEVLCRARPAKGRIPQRRWEVACEHLARLRLGSEPPLRTIVALVSAHRAQAAIDCARDAFGRSAGNPAQRETIRFVVGLAHVELARAARSSGPDKINAEIDALQFSAALFAKVTAGRGTVRSPALELLLNQATRQRDTALRAMLRSAIGAASTFVERCPDDDPKGCTRAIAVLDRVHGILQSEQCQDYAEEIAKNLAIFYLRRSRIHAVQGNLAHAKRDLERALNHDPRIEQNLTT